MRDALLSDGFAPVALGGDRAISRLTPAPRARSPKRERVFLKDRAGAGGRVYGASAGLGAPGRSPGSSPPGAGASASPPPLALEAPSPPSR